MTFSDPAFFLFFLPLCVLGYAAVARFQPRWVVGYLALASVLFYMQWSIRQTTVLLGSLLVNYAFSRAIAASVARPRLQSFWLTAGIAANLLTLCYFKYLFVFLNYTHDLGWTHRDWGIALLPLGISFFTFTQIAYLIDLKQGIASPENLARYSLFVTFFPHLIAGPILHHKEMMPQFRERRHGLKMDDLALGLTWFTMGLCKKAIIADRMAWRAGQLFQSPATMGATDSWHGVLAYTMQLYFDFSGYSDMAIGLARMFSIRFPMNFNSPYKATGMIDFWQRWHMTLTRYIMDYVYAPMQMKVSRWRMDHGRKVSRKAQATLSGMTQMVALPTIATMFLAGIWHGAGKQFLIFGLMHGAYITINHAWRLFVPETSLARRMMTAPVGTVLTFLAVMSTWVMFRARNLRDAIHVYGGLLGHHGRGHHIGLPTLVLMAALLAIVWFMPNTQEILGESQKEDDANWSLLRGVRWKMALPWWLLTAGAFVLSMTYCAASTTFLYFQF